jgi:hypothetical protein
VPFVLAFLVSSQRPGDHGHHPVPRSGFRVALPYVGTPAFDRELYPATVGQATLTSAAGWPFRDLKAATTCMDDIKIKRRST